MFHSSRGMKFLNKSEVVYTWNAFEWSVSYVDFTLQSDWFGNSLYDLIHGDDVEKLREQLSTTESQNTGRILDLKSNREFDYNITSLATRLSSYCLFVSLIFGSSWPFVKKNYQDNNVYKVCDWPKHKLFLI